MELVRKRQKIKDAILAVMQYMHKKNLSGNPLPYPTVESNTRHALGRPDEDEIRSCMGELASLGYVEAKGTPFPRYAPLTITEVSLTGKGMSYNPIYHFPPGEESDKSAYPIE